ncbi:MAG: N-acetylmuramoyl-L-alanine amidase [Deltaproteobacteria bacterium]|nr:N-acetylmuramoyl-L-alanine amidase [Deltaproteobacteria bacterium]
MANRRENHSQENVRFRGAFQSKSAILLNLKVTLFILVLFTFFLPGVLLSAQQQPHSKTYSEARKEFQRLVDRSDTSEEAFKKAALTFVNLLRTEKASNKSSCQFFAGKAYLNLYKRSKNIRHLDISITYLNDYKKSRHNSEYYKEALFELKEAYLLKRKARGTKSQETVASSVPGRSDRVPSTKNGAILANKTETKTTEEATSDQQPNESKQELLSFSPQLYDRLPLNRIGNPFFQPEITCVEPPREEAKLKNASIIPQSINDAKPDSSIAATNHEKGPVIVIDPGHGGRDPGAVSSDGAITEKQIALEISNFLKKHVEEVFPSARVFLTRTDDSFLSLKDRAKIANSLDAEVFISVHCNGSDFKSAAGPEIFYLSKSSSKGAMRAAARENGVSLSKMTDLEATLIDLLTTSKNSESNKLAQVVHNSLTANDSGLVSNSRDRGVKQAPFYVLIGATMPAILVECGFVNNLAQRDQNSRDKFIKSVALKLAKGTLEYLRKPQTIASSTDHR